jgi:gliding motility-associatede transport system auxiliary component
MSGLAVAGWIALVFGAGAYYAVGEAGWFSRVNLALGALALTAAIVRALARARHATAPAFRGPVLRGLLGILAVAAGGVALERLASASKLQFDWSFERRFELSEATRNVLAELGSVDATLYTEDFDPRIRSTRLLLQTMAGTGHLRFLGERHLVNHPEEANRFAIGSSNTVLLQLGDRFETVERPTEATLYEALYHLLGRQLGTLYVARGAGEGELSRTDGSGYSGLAAALQTEGYRLRDLVPASGTAIPADAAAVLVLAPRRPWRPVSLAALETYLENGGRLVAFLEPGARSGVEALLARWGLTSPDDLVVDPASGTVLGDAPGVDPLAFGYADHPITRGLDASRMTFFRGARTFVLRKPEPEDRVGGLVFASGRSWLTPDVGAATRREPLVPPPGTETDFHPLVVAGAYPRDGHEARIVAFGDAELASNRFLRTLYNLDLVLNAVHWATQHESAIELRPKVAVSGALQLPLPIQNTFTMFQGVGLLLPELLLLAGAWAWARGRSA